jgi:rhodanese-related sulfurtransferase
MVDCVQALGKLPLDLAATRIDYAPFSGHKLYAPKGIGMLYVRAGAPFTPLMKGGGQETGWRSGTENMAGIAALGAVLAALEDGTTFRSHAEQCAFRDRLADALRQALHGIVINAPFEATKPKTINFSDPGLSSKELLDLFDAAAVRVSAGSACSAAKAQPSYVLDAMGLPEWRSSNAVRLSFGPLMDDATVAEACVRIARCGDALRQTGLLGEPAATPPDGLLQLSAGGCHTWLVLDAASGTCAVIDPQAALAGRIDTLLRAHGYRVAAQLSTRTGAPWPASGERLSLGNQCLHRVAIGTDGVCYLLAREGDPPRHAFMGDAAASRLRGLLPPDVLLCSATEAQSALCTMLDADSGMAALDGMHLNAAGVASLFENQPGAVLVDVREPHEHAAALPFFGAQATSIPLSQLAGELPRWLARAERTPLVFFCRSGNRSARAAGCLRSLGYANAYHLQGGVALS